MQHESAIAIAAQVLRATLQRVVSPLSAETEPLHHACTPPLCRSAHGHRCCALSLGVRTGT
eukprot:8456907-Alexandrium_andersonii.AAC.1